MFAPFSPEENGIRGYPQGYGIRENALEHGRFLTNHLAPDGSASPDPTYENIFPASSTISQEQSWRQSFPKPKSAPPSGKALFDIPLSG